MRMITVDLTWFTKIQHNSEFLKNRDAIKNPLGKCFYPRGASRGRIYNWLTTPDGGGHLSWPSPGPRTCQRTTEAFSWLAKRSKVKQKGKTGKETDKLYSFSFIRFWKTKILFCFLKFRVLSITYHHIITSHSKILFMSMWNVKKLVVVFLVVVVFYQLSEPIRTRSEKACVWLTGKKL